MCSVIPWWLIISKRFWSYVKSNTNSTRIPESVHYQGRFRSDVEDQCQLFNKFFSDQFSESSNYNCQVNFSFDSDDFYVTCSIVRRYLLKVVPNKAPGPDGISGHVLRNCAKSLCYPLCILFNKSYNTGVLPQDWKNASVVPIHKKGDKDDVQNYRPVSLTSLVMKIFEKCLRDKLFKICQDKITSKQHGFLPNKSCDTQMIPFITSLSLTLGSKGQADVIYFDFSKAFDSVNHDIILYKLRDQFGVNGKMLHFIKNYLRNREQRVIIQNKFSSYLPVRSGVPQGSILGPILFILFINDLVDVLDPRTNILLYADDTKIWREISTIGDQQQLQHDINELYNWSVRNKIKFHPKKCKVLHITLKHNYLNYTYIMNNINLESSANEKDLGVIVCDNLSWNKQHTMILCKARQKLGLLKRVCSFTRNPLYRKVLYLALVRSLFEHCSTTWRPVTVGQIAKYKAIQKKAVKWILGEDFVHYRSNGEYFDKLKSLDILPISLKFDMSDMVLFHSIVYGHSIIELPTFLVSRPTGLVNPDTSGRFFQRHTRNTAAYDDFMFKCTFMPSINCTSNMFFIRAYKFWNSLPLSVREIASQSDFKSKLKRHLWSIPIT